MKALFSRSGILVVFLFLSLLYTLIFFSLSNRPEVTSSGNSSNVVESVPDTTCFTDQKFSCCEYNGICLPGLLVAGFMKCGTVQLNEDLSFCHPDIIGKRPEPKGIKERNLDRFVSTLSNVSHTDGYLSVASMPLMSHYPEETLKFMKLNMPFSRYILSMRNPADRDYSHFKMNVRKGWSRYSDIPLPSDCFADTSECLYNLLLDTIVHIHPVWNRCVKEKVGGFIDARSSPEALDKWCDCILNHPDQFWVKGMLEVALEKDYLRTAIRFDAVFGRDQWLPIRAEDFFNADPDLIDSLLSFAGLKSNEFMTPCFKKLGNSKVDQEASLDVKRGINTTKMTPKLKRLLLTLHKHNIDRLQSYLQMDFHWYSGFE